MTETESPAEFLQRWYLDQCDGEWEHEFGVTIGNIDNPGWSIAIDLVGTALEDRLLDYQVLQDAEPTWVHCWSDGKKFQAAAGPSGLLTALEQFRKFSTST